MSTRATLVERRSIHRIERLGVGGTDAVIGDERLDGANAAGINSAQKQSALPGRVLHASTRCRGCDPIDRQIDKPMPKPLGLVDARPVGLEPIGVAKCPGLSA
jgi:hypothetical protein